MRLCWFFEECFSVCLAYEYAIVLDVFFISSSVSAIRGIHVIFCLVNLLVNWLIGEFR